MSLFDQIVQYGRMIKFSHSVFALPFALTGAMLAATVTSISFRQIGWIMIAMIAVRSAAMGFNRLVDRHLDSANPRTCERELPRGAMSVISVGTFIIASSGVFVLAAHKLNPVCFQLSPVALAVVFFYSYTKRFTWGSHLVLGLCLSLAPLGAWVAITGRIDFPPLVLGFAVLFWVAGFDVLYACQDQDFDRTIGLHSIPARFGLVGALNVARMFHGLAVGFMLVLAYVMELNLLYLAGVGVITVLLFFEHRMVRADDLTKVNTAFLTMNSVVSVVYFLFTVADLLLLGEWSNIQLMTGKL